MKRDKNRACVWLAGSIDRPSTLSSSNTSVSLHATPAAKSACTAMRSERKLRLPEALNGSLLEDREVPALRHFEELSHGERAAVKGGQLPFTGPVEA
jgi:hypothetical protein